MIGQEMLINYMDIVIASGNYPKFSIITGMSGCGKKTLAKHVIEKLGVNVVYNCNIAVADVREAITAMYKVAEKSVYTFYDVDTMSIQAKNALLKVAEEPPNNVYIIMTVSDMNTVLSTIKSRATIYCMLPYTQEQILEYANANSEDAEIIKDICDTPGEVELLKRNGVQELWDYVNKVIDNIAVVSTANAFKIADKIAFKGEEKGKYDVLLFVKAFRKLCAELMIQDDTYYSTGVKIASRFITQSYITGINKQALFDMFVIDIRKEWAE